MIAHDMGRELSIGQAQKLASALDAAYEYEKHLCEIAKNGMFNFDNHGGDWIDLQQLFYLADPNVYFLTEDKDIRQRCGSSLQSNRILLLKEI